MNTSTSIANKDLKPDASGAREGPSGLTDEQVELHAFAAWHKEETGKEIGLKHGRYFCLTNAQALAFLAWKYRGLHSVPRELR